MNAQEAAALCRYVAACCPQQKLDPYTPDAWLDLLGDLDYPDAKQGAAAVARRQPFVSPSEIRDEVARIRRARLDAHGPIEPPPGLEGQAYVAWLRATTGAIASGRTAPELTGGDRD